MPRLARLLLPPTLVSTWQALAASRPPATAPLAPHHRRPCTALAARPARAARLGCSSTHLNTRALDCILRIACLVEKNKIDPRQPSRSPAPAVARTEGERREGLYWQLEGVSPFDCRP